MDFALNIEVYLEIKVEIRCIYTKSMLGVLLNGFRLKLQLGFRHSASISCVQWISTQLWTFCMSIYS